MAKPNGSEQYYVGNRKAAAVGKTVKDKKFDEEKLRYSEVHNHHYHYSGMNWNYANDQTSYSLILDKS